MTIQGQLNLRDLVRLNEEQSRDMARMLRIGPKWDVRHPLVFLVSFLVVWGLLS